MRRKRKVMVVVLLVLTLVVGISYSSFVVGTGSIEASRLLISNMMYKIDIKSTGGSEVISGRKVSLTSGNTSVIGSNRWWTMTPTRYLDDGIAMVFDVCCSTAPGSLLAPVVTEKLAVRPVVSLKSTVKVSGGNGTAESPYTVE